MNEPPGLTEILPLEPGVEVRVRIARDVPPCSSPEVERRWAELCASNPRFHDGLILSVVSLDALRGEIHARRDRYARLAVQPQVHTGVRLLGVTGVLTAKDAAGRAHVLLGRRGPQVRLYADQWELGPSGGVTCPAGDTPALSFDDLVHSLADEIEEEVGLPPPVNARAIALLRDHRARSDDVVIAGDAGSLEAATETMRPSPWEYRETLWLPLDAIEAFDRGNTIIDASRAVLRLLGHLASS